MQVVGRHFSVIVAAIALVSCLVCSPPPSFAEQPAARADADSDAAAIQPEAADLYRAMCSTLASAEAFTVHADVAYDEVLRSGAKLQFGAAAELVVRRPDRVAVDYRGDLDSKKLWYDGTTVTLLNVSENLYSQTAAPATIDGMVTAVSREYGLTFPMGELLYDDLYQKTMSTVRSGIVVGPALVEGVECMHLAFAEDAADWQVWIDKSAHPLPRKIVVTYKHLPGQPQYEAHLRAWNLQAKPTQTQFTADTGTAERIEFLPLAGPGRTQPDGHAPQAAREPTAP